LNAHEIKPGVVYQDANVKVTAFATRHTMESYGYRFETADRSIVFSGDTTAAQSTIDACNGCDILVHEVLSHDWLSRRPDFAEYARRYHTTTTQLAELARKARPKLLVLYHSSVSWRPVVDNQRSRPEVMLQEMISRYPGHVVVGRDLDVY
jgi:ribonuclease BN (tRNA processing enzyme)